MADSNPYITAELAFFKICCCSEVRMMAMNATLLCKRLCGRAVSFITVVFCTALPLILATALY